MAAPRPPRFVTRTMPTTFVTVVLIPTARVARKSALVAFGRT